MNRWSPCQDGPKPQSAQVDGVELRSGARVRLHPQKRADLIDLLLAGRTATVISIERDFEGRIYLAVMVDEDPGRDLGPGGRPGHRFFFRPDEVEPLPQRPDECVPPAGSPDQLHLPADRPSGIGRPNRRPEGVEPPAAPSELAERPDDSPEAPP
jgi:hypothetical protein